MPVKTEYDIHQQTIKQTTELEILYKDDHLVAVNKPSGLMVHRSAVDTRETTFAPRMVRDQIGNPVFPVHRLDRPTSGILLFALHPETGQPICLSAAPEPSFADILKQFSWNTGACDEI